MAKYFSFVLLLLVIVLLAILFFKVMFGFLIPMFLAAILVVIFGPFHSWMFRKMGGRKKLAALATTISIILVVLLPFGILFGLAAAEARQFARGFSSAELVHNLSKIRKSIGVDFPSAEEFRAIESDFMDMRASDPQNNIERKSELDRQQVLLSNIASNGDKLATALGLSPVATNANPQLRTAWNEFKSELVELGKLHQSIQFESDPLKLADLYPEYHSKIGQAYRSYSNFKDQQLGGKLQSWLRENANPTTDHLIEEAQPVLAYARDQLLSLGASTTLFAIKILLGTFITVISLYFFLVDGPGMIASIKNLSPINDLHEEELIREFGQVSRAVVLATLLSALVQGMLGGVGYYFAGLDSIFLLAMLTSCLALVPFVGAASVWVPCCLYLFFVDNSLPAAVGLGIYGLAVISFADNIIKPLVLHGQSNLHPLIALLSVLGGIATMGPIGLLIGPMVVAFLQTLLKILQRELSTLDSTDPTLAESPRSELELVGNLPIDLQLPPPMLSRPNYILAGPPLDDLSKV